MIIWTLGHSTRSIEELAALLAEHGIGLLCDVRRFPGSRRFPQFNREPLAEAMTSAGVGYEWWPELGGRREPAPDSRNTAWRNASFRGYADYMDTQEFAAAAERLVGLARERRTAILCSEALWQRCHRGLIADYLKARGVEVIHIVGPGMMETHPFTSAARLVNGQLSYVLAETDGRLPGFSEG